ncbi:transcriptional regulator [Sphingomonas psychrotolerans]|uniref:Transcriptional regulator n=1 Tax=Sphingomonas psychrotolerans TaxID=1327635 RepID=A0ABU3N843_9SPHN|nr:transcriptional regulator [Sphingomonas psychrotolerans]MDT8760451.1 transcriptional regulator [Sphingomonas psychrotolerans]
MTSGSFRFDRFLLDIGDRQLRCDGAPVELNARYFDALVLLVREQGRLVSKDRFFEQVWRGMPVTDEALTQCIRTLRRQLGDSATDPRFIETVPRHGYRFIAAVEQVAEPLPQAAEQPVAAAPSGAWRAALLPGAAGTLGAGGAGTIGGLIYGFVAASQPLPGMGAISVLLVLLCLTILVALLGGAGVAFGIAAAQVAMPRSWPWRVAGGAIGGLLVGGVVKLLGIDAFGLLLGQSPGEITGAGEGAVLGGAAGLASWFAARGLSLRRGVMIAALLGGGAGLLITALGGRLMAGSLALLGGMPQSRLRLDLIGSLFGENDFGPVSRMATAGLEGALFGGCLTGAMLLARKRRANMVISPLRMSGDPM